MDNQNPKPGLEPRGLDAEVSMNVESDRLTDATSTGSNDTNLPEKGVEQSISQVGQEVAPEKDNAQAEKPMSDREANRVQVLANRATQAEARAAQAEAMLQRVVGAQAPQPSEQETLVKKYKSYDEAQGFPTDPKEYAQYTSERAAFAGEQAALKAAANAIEQQQIAELIKAYPEIGNDPALYGAMVAERSATNNTISFKDAADVATRRLQKRFSKIQQEQEDQDTADKNAAYVESSRGASQSRGSAIDPSQMNLEEMERALKQSGQWNERHSK